MLLCRKLSPIVLLLMCVLAVAGAVIHDRTSDTYLSFVSSATDYRAY